MSNYIAGVPTVASSSSISRWKRTVEAQTPSGNRHNDETIAGEYEELLKLFRLAYPKAHLLEASAFLFNHATVPHLFHPSTISRKEMELGFTFKKSSTIAQQVYQENIQKRIYEFFHCPPPYGIYGVPLESIIDTDESPWTVNALNRDAGKAFHCHRVQDKGHYSKGTKWTLILSICGDGTMKYFRFTQDPGTTAAVFADYIEQLLNLLPENKIFYFVWDNLNVHLNDIVYNLVTSRGHYVIPRPPYFPQAGPIEFVFNQIDRRLQENYASISSEDEMIRKMNEILFNLHGIKETFLHCGYH